MLAAESKGIAAKRTVRADCRAQRNGHEALTKPDVYIYCNKDIASALFGVLRANNMCRSFFYFSIAQWNIHVLTVFWGYYKVQAGRDSNSNHDILYAFLGIYYRKEAISPPLLYNMNLVLKYLVCFQRIYIIYIAFNTIRKTMQTMNCFANVYLKPKCLFQLLKLF